MKNIPLSLYSLGSSFLPLMLNDEDALESAYPDLWDPVSAPSDALGCRVSSATPLTTGGFLPKGLRKGAILLAL